MTWADILTRIRRYLRDPDGDIWTDADILTLFNDAALEIAIKTGLIIRVEAHYYPPEFDYSYLYDWEKSFTEGTPDQALNVNQVREGNVITYPWEVAYWLDEEPSADEGNRFIHGFESEYASPAEVVKIPLHAKFSKMKFVGWNEEPIDHRTEAEIAAADGFYRTTQGTPAFYYHPDQQHNQIIIYPRPSVTWQDTDHTEVLDDDGNGMITYDEGWLDIGDLGITYDVIDAEEALFCVYEAYPVEVSELEDEPDFAPYITKYIEAATLERAFGIDSDGYIASLRDHWKFRKDVGIEAIKKWRRLGLTARTYRLGGNLAPKRTRTPQLPADQYVDKY